MTTSYRIEIDLFVEDGTADGIVDLARRHYQSGHRAWSEENGKRISIPAEEFIQDVEGALLELVEAAFQDSIPQAEARAFRCGLISDEVGAPASGTDGG